MFFSAITKNSNWEILSKNLVTFKRRDGVKDQNFNITGVHWKIRFLGWGGERHEKNTIFWGELPKKWDLDSLQI